jgi:hypothetical protein
MALALRSRLSRQHLTMSSVAPTARGVRNVGWSAVLGYAEACVEGSNRVGVRLDPIWSDRPRAPPPATTCQTSRASNSYTGLLSA